MYAEGGWGRCDEPPPRPPRRADRRERAFLWIIGVNALLLLLAPIGGASIVHAILALLGRG